MCLMFWKKMLENWKEERMAFLLAFLQFQLRWCLSAVPSVDMIFSRCWFSLAMASFQYKWYYALHKNGCVYIFRVWFCYSQNWSVGDNHLSVAALYQRDTLNCSEWIKLFIKWMDSRTNGKTHTLTPSIQWWYFESQYLFDVKDLWFNAVCVYDVLQSLDSSCLYNN